MTIWYDQPVLAFLLAGEHADPLTIIPLRTAVYTESLIVRTKLTPPRPPRHAILRPRLVVRLQETLQQRLTVVQAGTGYGKSTMLATLRDGSQPLVWYHLSTEDADPLVFLRHLLHAFAEVAPATLDMPLVLLEQWERERGSMTWTAVVDALINAITQATSQPLRLVLDDAHRLNNTAESIRILDRFIGRAPDNLHIILASRYPLPLPSLVNWRVRGELLEIGQDELAFTAAEIERLFREQYGVTLTPEQVALLLDRVEGWAIALPLVWQRWQSGGDTASLADALGQLSGSANDLFAYLSQEVLAQQPADVQDFLRKTAVLRQMTAANCDHLRQASDSRQILRYLQENGLFMVNLGNGVVRYHHLFRDQLHHQLLPAAAHDAHLRAATFYREQGEDEEAVYHLLTAVSYNGEHQAAALQETAVLLTDLGRKLVRQGRLDTLANWLGALPPAVLEAHPPLLAYLGDIARLRSHFDEALAWYQQAEAFARNQNDIPAIGQALRGQARVYLDTVNPSKAETLLQEALRVSDDGDNRESRARLLELLAENMLNQGRTEAAQTYQQQARELRQSGPVAADLPVRLLLRTGRLDEARRLLTVQADSERAEPVLRPRAHRETLLLLSLIHAFQGDQLAAYDTAVAGTQRGEALNSGFVTGVGHMRQGHAWLLLKNERGYGQAQQSFETAVAIIDALEVPRLKVEAYWGLCQVYGFRGEIELAEEIAQQGAALAQNAGDEWVEACIRVTLGASYVLIAPDTPREVRKGYWQQGQEALAQAATAYRDCGDTYGETVARLWQCLLWQQTGDKARLSRDLDDLLHLIRRHQYGFLFARQTLIGPPDPRSLVPLLLWARDAGIQSATADRLLRDLDLAMLELHPGYQLRMHTLGAFRLWRGSEEVPARDWRRKKARQLFHLLLTHRAKMMHRDQIAEILWPELDPDGAQRDFKIAYSALCSVLEPARKRNAPSAFVARDGTLYGLRPEADIWLDTAEFEHYVAEGDLLWETEQAAALPAYRAALSLYQGEYLQEYPYEEWNSELRERLLTVYLRTAERVALLLAAQQQWDTVITVCQAILERDDCWEQAYRLMMQAYGAQGNRTQALRIYQRCVEKLDAELGVTPAAATVDLYQQLL